MTLKQLKESIQDKNKIEKKIQELEKEIDLLTKEKASLQDKIDKVFVANDMIPNEVLKAYLLEHSTKVPLSDIEHEYEVELCSLLSFENRLVRHDAKKVKEVFLKELGE